MHKPCKLILKASAALFSAFIVLSCGCISSNVSQDNTSAKPAPATTTTNIESIYYCESDADCVKVQTTCCPCSMGGKEECANKAHSDSLKPRNCRKDIACVALYACSIGECKCVKNKCVGSELR